MKFDEFRNAVSTLARMASQQNNLSSFMPGTYQRDKEDSGPLVEERIVICPVSATAGLYRIQRVTCYHASIEEKRIYTPKAEQWTASYDWASRQLVEIGGGRSCAFFPEASQMFFNNVPYFKISNTKQTRF